MCKNSNTGQKALMFAKLFASFSIFMKAENCHISAHLPSISSGTVVQTLSTLYIGMQIYLSRRNRAELALKLFGDHSAQAAQTRAHSKVISSIYGARRTFSLTLKYFN